LALGLSRSGRLSDDEKIVMPSILFAIYNRENTSGANQALAAELKSLAADPNKQVAAYAATDYARLGYLPDTKDVLDQALRSGALPTDSYFREMAHLIASAPPEKQSEFMAEIRASSNRLASDILADALSSGRDFNAAPFLRSSEDMAELLRATEPNFGREPGVYGGTDGLRYETWLRASAIIESTKTGRKMDDIIVAKLSEPGTDPRKLLAYLSSWEAMPLLTDAAPDSQVQKLAATARRHADQNPGNSYMRFLAETIEARMKHPPPAAPKPVFKMPSGPATPSGQTPEAPRSILARSSGDASMPTDIPRTALQLRSLIKRSGELELSLVEEPIPEPKPDEVIVRVEAAPMNPSDLGLLFGAADMKAAKASGTPERPVVTAPVPEGVMKAMAGRLDQSMPVGNEGAGVVVAAGASPAAQALLGKVVAAIGGAMYTQYRCLPAAQCMPLPEGTTPAEGASAFVNPLTALGMVETMKREGHKALVHTAAASNLGQMLNRICLADGIELVNIVRRKEQADILRAIGAKHVCDASAPTFMEDLTEALAATGATLAFDAIGGGKLAGQILNAMEAALLRKATEYSRYGSTTHKQVYIYGGLDRGPTEFTRGFGMTWGMGGWLLFPFLQKIGPEGAAKLRARVAAELKTTFASHYTREVSLREALKLEEIAVYAKQATGEKYLLNPNRT
jgi:NADPH2:quinone reductase